MRVAAEGSAYGESEAGHWMVGQNRMTRIMVLELAMVCAVEGCALMPFKQHTMWVAQREAEHFEQGDEEVELGLLVTPLMSRSKPGISSPINQVRLISPGRPSSIACWHKLLFLPSTADSNQALSGWQVGWIDIIVLPAYQEFCTTFTACRPLLEKLVDNRWGELAACFGFCPCSVNLDAHRSLQGCLV